MLCFTSNLLISSPPIRYIQKKYQQQKTLSLYWFLNLKWNYTACSDIHKFPFHNNYIWKSLICLYIWLYTCIKQKRRQLRRLSPLTGGNFILSDFPMIAHLWQSLVSGLIYQLISYSASSMLIKGSASTKNLHTSLSLKCLYIFSLSSMQICRKMRRSVSTSMNTIYIPHQTAYIFPYSLLRRFILVDLIKSITLDLMCQ